MYDGGIRLLEITYSASGIPSDEVTAENIKALCNHFKEVGKTDMHIGAGTVLTVEQVVLTKAVGGDKKEVIAASAEAVERSTSLGMIKIYEQAFRLTNPEHD